MDGRMKIAQVVKVRQTNMDRAVGTKVMSPNTIPGKHRKLDKSLPAVILRSLYILHPLHDVVVDSKWHIHVCTTRNTFLHASDKSDLNTVSPD